MTKIDTILPHDFRGSGENARRLLAIWLSTALLLCGMVISNEIGSGSPLTFASGSGVPEDPYIITNVWELQNMSTDLTAHYALGNDIDATITSGWNAGAGFEPVGAGPWNVTENHFKGRLDGRNYTITGLYINRPTMDYQGLFGYIGPGSTVKNVGIVNNDVTGYTYVGGLSGGNWDGTIHASYTTGTAVGKRAVGGLVGESGGTISSSYSYGTVNGEGFIGGLVGFNWVTVMNSFSTGTVSGTGYVGGLVGVNDGNVTDSYATGTVKGLRYIGGLVGWNDLGTVKGSHATGSVSGDLYVGGLVGENGNVVVASYASGSVKGENSVGGLAGLSTSGAIIDRSCAAGIVTGGLYVGGLVGRNGGMVSDSYATGKVTGYIAVGGLIGQTGATVSNSYATGPVSGEDYVGGLVGDNEGGIVSNCVWDTQTSGRTTSDGGTGKTTAEMTMQSTFTDAGWDFDDIWWMEDGKTYPLLTWQDEPLTGTGNNKLLSNIQWALIILAAAISAALLAALLLRRRSKPAAAEPPQATEPRPEEPPVGEEEPRDNHP